MADHNNQEVIYLRHAVVRLANEIDYKNHLLMEKEGLSLERFASMSSLIEEKDRLLDERSAVIGSLMAQKHRQHEVFIEETQKCIHLKQEMKNLRHELKVQQQKLDTRTIKQEELLAVNGEGLGIVTINSTNGNKGLESPEIDLINNKHDNKLLDSMNKLQHLRAQNEDQKAQLEKLKNELNEKGEALHQLESLNQTLVLNERSSNEELKDARMEAIKCFLTMDNNETKVGIKRIGEIDPQPFRDVCSKKLCSRNWEEESTELYSLWQENVKDPSWNPFKKEIKNGQVSETVDENDKKLVELREEWGEEPSKAVVTALLDLKEYNPILRSSIPELWNFEEGRRANLKEVIQYMIHQWEVNRNKAIEQSGSIIGLMEEKQKLLQKLASLNILMEEKDKVLKQKYAAVGKLIAQDMEKDKLIGQLSVTISSLKAEKHSLLETCNAEIVTMKCMKEQTEKLKKLQSQEELAKRTEESKETKQHNCRGDKSVTIKEDYSKSRKRHLDSLTVQVGPIAENWKHRPFHNTKEQISSTSENRKFQGEMLKLCKTEPGMLGELSHGKWDVLELLKPTTHSISLPSKALVSFPSNNSITLERFFQTTNVKKEDED